MHTYKTKYEGWETYQEKEVRGRSTDTNYRLTTNTLTYDVMGRLASQQEHTSYHTPIDDRMRYFAYNGDGRVQLRRAGTLNGSGTFVQTAGTDGSMDNTLFVHAAGQQQAELKEGGTTRTHHGSTVITQQLQSLSGSGNYNAGGGKVTVQPGETLQTLAQRIYGSSQRWYVLADANGMSDPTQVLIEGTQINAPNVNVSSNDAGTFKPYNPGEAIGSTSPSLPYILPPPKNQCNEAALILMIIIAVAVTWATWGALAPEMSIWISGATAATAAGGVTVAGAVAAGFVAGVAGSVASQAFGSAMGVASFSWKQVAVDGITSAITMGAGQWLQGMNGGASAFTKGGEVIDGVKQLGTVGRVTQGVISYGGSMVANMAVGRDTNFSWKAVAASAVGAFVSAKIGGRIPIVEGGASAGSFLNNFAGGLVNGAANATVRRLFGYGKQDWVDVFGNALANAVVGAIGDARANRANASEENDLAGGMGGVVESWSGESAHISGRRPSGGSSMLQGGADKPLSNAIASTSGSSSEFSTSVNTTFDPVVVTANHDQNRWHMAMWEWAMRNNQTAPPATANRSALVKYWSEGNRRLAPDYDKWRADALRSGGHIHHTPAGTTNPYLGPYNAINGAAGKVLGLVAPNLVDMVERGVDFQSMSGADWGKGAAKWGGNLLIGIVNVASDAVGHATLLGPLLDAVGVDYHVPSIAYTDHELHAAAVLDVAGLAVGAISAEVTVARRAGQAPKLGDVRALDGLDVADSASVEVAANGSRLRNVEFAGGPQEYVPDLSHVTGKGAQARSRAIDSIVREDFPNLDLTHQPQYSPFIRTGIAQEGVGTQIGKMNFSSRADLRNVIVHEELHHRWWARGILDHHPAGSAKEFRFYETIRRYERMRGWGE